jgi:hypothetical protein
MGPNEGVHAPDDGHGEDSEGGGIKEMGNDKCGEEMEFLVWFEGSTPQAVKGFLQPGT